MHSSKVAVLSEGHMMKTALRVVHRLEEAGYHPTLVNLRFIKPLDTELIRELSRDHDLFVTIEENVRAGGVGEHIAAYVTYSQLPVKVLSFGIDDVYVKQGSIAVLRKAVGLDWETISDEVLRYLEDGE